jgi:hypothetical protein
VVFDIGDPLSPNFKQGKGIPKGARVARSKKVGEGLAGPHRKEEGQGGDDRYVTVLRVVGHVE